MMNEFEKEALNFFCDIFHSYGMQDLPMKIMATLYLESEEISMDEIAKKTGYSLASICNSMKLLENIGTIQRIKKPKTRKVFFYMEKNLIKLNIQKLKAAQESFTKKIMTDFPPFIEKYKGKVKDEKSKRKLKIIEDYYRQVGKFEHVLKKWKKDLEQLSKT